MSDPDAGRAEQLIDVFRQAGVERVYGVVGSSPQPGHGHDPTGPTGLIEWVHVRNEEAGAFAAAAEAQLTVVCRGSVVPSRRSGDEIGDVARALEVETLDRDECDTLRRIEGQIAAADPELAALLRASQDASSGPALRAARDDRPRWCSPSRCWC